MDSTASFSRSVTPAFWKHSFFAMLKSAADLPEKKLVSWTRSYAGRGSSQNTDRSKSPRPCSCSRKRCPTMPLPMTTTFSLMHLLKRNLYATQDALISKDFFNLIAHCCCAPCGAMHQYQCTSIVSERKA